MKIKTGKYYSQWGFGVSFINYTRGMWSIVLDIGPYYIDFDNMNGNEGDNLAAFNEFYKNIDDDFGPAPDCEGCGKESDSWDDLMYHIDQPNRWELLCKKCIDEKKKTNEEPETNT
jgi:hypothetical protein